MKFECPCGAKYAFDLSPELSAAPPGFVCPECGRDSSGAVNELIRAPSAGPAVRVPAPPVRVHVPAPVSCPKHRGQPVVECCVVCGKPLCALCLKLFGYVCSPHCRQKAELTGIGIPEYELSNVVQERKYQRKLNLTIFGGGGALALIISLWLWYLLVGSQPRPAYIARLTPPAYSGQIHLVGKNELIVIHGTTLSRHDVATKQVVWSADLVNRVELVTRARAELQEMDEALRRRQLQGKDTERYALPTLEQLTAMFEREYAAELQLHVRGEKIWIAQPDRFVRYDGATGQPAQTVALRFGPGGTSLQDDNLVALRESTSGEGEWTRVNLLTGEVRTEKFPVPPGRQPVASDPLARALIGGDAANGGRALDPTHVAAQAQRLPIQGRLALPATISIQQGQNRLMQEMDEMDNGPGRAPLAEAPRKPDLSVHATTFVTATGPVEFSWQLLEERFVERPAMKSPPKTSALAGPSNVNSTMEAANELLNEVQRARGADKIMENESRYRVTVRWPGKDNAPEWKTELTGPPEFHPLKTMNLIIAGKKVVALDARNRPLWEHTLSHSVGESTRGAAADGSGNTGTITEREGSVFLADQGVLTALDAPTGNVRWRFPTVGVSGLFFDDAGMLYVNSTTADPDNLTYSRQIDITRNVSSLIVKLNPADGTTLWRTEARGLVTHVSGKFVYTVDASAPDDGEDAQAVFGLKPAPTRGYVRIRRIHPGNGDTKWEYQQSRAPLDVEFSGRSIQILFPNEAQVLRFLSF